MDHLRGSRAILLRRQGPIHEPVEIVPAAPVVLAPLPDRNTLLPQGSDAIPRLRAQRRNGRSCYTGKGENMFVFITWLHA